MANFAVTGLKIGDVLSIKPRRFADERGWFSEVYREETLDRLGLPVRFVQDNHAYSAAAGTIRGLHFQAPPHAQAKLVRVSRGAVFDVAVDLRTGSETYGHWVGAQLTAEGGEQLFVPAGFAHGYCTLQPDTEVLYKCDAYYAPESEGGILATDPALGIRWPVPASDLTLSAKDMALPTLRDLKSPFVMQQT